MLRQKTPVLLFNIFIILILIFQTGCFSGASPGMKVLKITSEQYYNDAVRYLKDNNFVYDSSKIRSVLKNLEENPPTGKTETREKIELMVRYLNILRLYAELFQRGSIPSDRDISDIEKMFDDTHIASDHLFLRLFLLYVKSFSREGLQPDEKISLVSLGEFLTADEEFRFPFYFGGIPIDVSLVRYLYYTCLLQNRVVLPVIEKISKSESISPEPVELIMEGESFFRMGDYDNALKFLKYFRLPTFSEHVFTDYALSMLQEIYKKKEMKVDMEVVQEKMNNRMRSRFERIFPYLSDEDMLLYSYILSPDTEEIKIVRDMLDMEEGRIVQQYVREDFSDIQLYELSRVFEKETGIKTESVQEPFFYNILNELYEIDIHVYPVFLNDRMLLLTDKEQVEFFVRINDNILKKLGKRMFVLDFQKEWKEERLVLDLEMSSPGEDLVEKKIIFGIEEDGSTAD